MLVKQELYCLSHAPALFALVIFEIITETHHCTQPLLVEMGVS
jgi:hypothetical protein